MDHDFNGFYMSKNNLTELLTSSNLQITLPGRWNDADGYHLCWMTKMAHYSIFQRNWTRKTAIFKIFQFASKITTFDKVVYPPLQVIKVMRRRLIDVINSMVLTSNLTLKNAYEGNIVLILLLMQCKNDPTTTILVCFTGSTVLE